MTPDDAEQITAIVAAAEQRTAEAIAATEQRTTEAIADLAARTDATITAAKDQTVEAVRDMQTEMLRGIEAFARGNFARLHRIETSDADTNTRISALEERVLYLETRRPPQ